MNLVLLQDNRAITTSLIVAEYFEKRHDSVLRDIRNLRDKLPHLFEGGIYFIAASYINKQNKCLPMYHITQEGYDLLYNRYSTKTHTPKEAIIRDVLQSKLGGSIEVKTPYGNIDILTEDKIIEVKTYKDYKHALGQILFYGSIYRAHEKWVYLFDYTEQHNFDRIKPIFEENNIQVELVLDIDLVTYKDSRELVKDIINTQAVLF